MYAILDIETTGGKYNEEGITEIAIYRFDGHEITDQFASLINPQKKIQPFVVKLTGINNNMLRTAPKFYEVAKRIVEITEGCILVAHNAKFDSRILSTEFRRLGYEYHRKSICTVQLAKKLLPDMPSYSLGKLTKSMGIPLNNRHRAQGDALATVSLFKLLLNKDTEKSIVNSYIIEKHTLSRKTKLLSLLETVPTETGVYYLYDKNGKIIYIGHGKNMRKSINQHFTASSSRHRKIQKEVEEISFFLTGNMLIAILQKDEGIQTNKPLYSRRSKRALFPYQLIQYKDSDDYICLKIEKVDLRKKPLMTFQSLTVANQNLMRITEEFELSPIKNHLTQLKTSKIIEDAKTYNKRVQKFLKEYVENSQTYLLIDKGRQIGEHSVILIENGVYKGYGFYTLNHQITNKDIFKKILTTPKNERYARHIIDDYLMKNSVQKILEAPIEK